MRVRSSRGGDECEEHGIIDELFFRFFITSLVPGSSPTEAAPIKCDGRESAGRPTDSHIESVGRPTDSLTESVGKPADSLPSHFIGAASGCV